MYQSLLQAVSMPYVSHPSELGAFLQSLQPYVRALRNRYQSTLIQVDYADPLTQAAYLLTYYPGYVEQMRYNLQQALQSPQFHQVFTASNMTVALIGSGPMPEGLALAICRQQLEAQHRLETISLDLNATGWKPARQVTQTLAAKLAPTVQYACKAYGFDLTSDHGLTVSQQQAISRSQLVVFQNCLNEIPPAQSAAFRKNLRTILACMPSSSALLVSDLSNYVTTQQRFADIRNLLQEEGIQFLYQERKTLYLSSILPSSLRQHLLTGADGLIPRGKIQQTALCAVKLRDPRDLTYPQIGSSGQQRLPAFFVRLRKWLGFRPV